MSGVFARLFSPLALGPLRATNRIVVAPHSTNLAEANRVSERHLAYYGDKARGGAGIVTIGGLRIHPTTVGGPLSITAYDDGCRDGLTRLADAVHDGGARVVGQLLHMGRQRSGGPTDWPMWAPSPLACPVMRETPHAVTLAEIAELMTCYAGSTRFAREAVGDARLHAEAEHKHLRRGRERLDDGEDSLRRVRACGFLDVAQVLGIEPSRDIEAPVWALQALRDFLGGRQDVWQGQLHGLTEFRVAPVAE